jgi:hypothetical protein
MFTLSVTSRGEHSNFLITEGQTEGLHPHAGDDFTPRGEIKKPGICKL